MNHNSTGKAVPVLIGGLVGGILSALPVVGSLNCLCCSLAVAGGLIAGALYTRQALPGQVVTYGDGALVGMLAGLVAGAIDTVVTGLFYLVSGVSIQSQIQEALQEVRNNPDVPPEAIEIIERFASSGGLGAVAIIGFVLVGWLLFAIFASIGGCLGVALFKRPGSAPPPTAYTPPAPPQ